MHPVVILEEAASKFGAVRITQSPEDGRITYLMQDWVYSEIDVHGFSTSYYIHAMHNLIVQSGAKRVVTLGTAGGTLATSLHYHGCRVSAVDIDPNAFTFARRYFHLPEDIECIVKDGMRFLQDEPALWDAIAIDVFGADGCIPEALIRPEFFQLVKQRLTLAGVMVMNVAIAHDSDPYADRIARTIEGAGLPVRIFDWPGMGKRSLVIAAGVNIPTSLSLGNEPALISPILENAVCRAAA